MTTYIIGIDIGTGSTKALAVNKEGHVILTSQTTYTNTTTPQGHCEQSPESIFHAFISCINKITQKLDSNPIAISLSSAMHSLIPVDTAGTPLMDMMTWADNRSSRIATKIRNSSSGEMIYEQTGTPIHAMSPLFKIIWLKENEPQLFSNTDKFISIKEYIWFRLFQVYEIDYSIASATGLMDIQSLQWNKNALELSGITENHLSSLTSTNSIRSNANELLCKKMRIDTSTPFVIGASDGCLANLGSFATEPGVAALTIGTSGAIRIASKQPIYNFKAMTFNYILDEHTFISGGPSNNGGFVLRWFAETFFNKTLHTIEDYTELLQGIDTIPAGCDGLTFLPYIQGERAPIWNSEASGVFFGMKSKHTQAHFTRAVIEGISIALFDIAEHMIRDGGTIERIHVSGGFVRSASWLKILANIFNKRICLVYADDASAIGAAYLGLKTLNIISAYDSLKPSTVREILPQHEHTDVYKQKLVTYRNIYQHLQPLMQAAH